jgi:hypothetical protein
LFVESLIICKISSKKLSFFIICTAYCFKVLAVGTRVSVPYLLHTCLYLITLPPLNFTISYISLSLMASLAIGILKWFNKEKSSLAGMSILICSSF